MKENVVFPDLREDQYQSVRDWAQSQQFITGTVVTWYVPDGSKVKKGDAICCVETEKVAVDVEAPGDGVLEVIVREGAEVTFPVVLARIAGNV